MSTAPITGLSRETVAWSRPWGSSKATIRNLVWLRERLGNQLRSQLREFYPVALATFTELTGRDAPAVLTVAPTPPPAGN